MKEKQGTRDANGRYPSWNKETLQAIIAKHPQAEAQLSVLKDEAGWFRRFINLPFYPNYSQSHTVRALLEIFDGTGAFDWRFSEETQEEHPRPPGPLRVMIVDRTPISSLNIKAFIEINFSGAAVETTDNCHDAAEKIPYFVPDIVILDGKTSYGDYGQALLEKYTRLTNAPRLILISAWSLGELYYHTQELRNAHAKIQVLGFYERLTSLEKIIPWLKQAELEIKPAKEGKQAAEPKKVIVSKVLFVHISGQLLKGINGYAKKVPFEILAADTEVTAVGMIRKYHPDLLAYDVNFPLESQAPIIGEYIRIKGEDAYVIPWSVEKYSLNTIRQMPGWKEICAEIKLLDPVVINLDAMVSRSGEGVDYIMDEIIRIVSGLTGISSSPLANGPAASPVSAEVKTNIAKDATKLGRNEAWVGGYRNPDELLPLVLLDSGLKFFSYGSSEVFFSTLLADANRNIFKKIKFILPPEVHFVFFWFYLSFTERTRTIFMHLSSPSLFRIYPDGKLRNIYSNYTQPAVGQDSAYDMDRLTMGVSEYQTAMTARVIRVILNNLPIDYGFFNIANRNVFLIPLSLGMEAYFVFVSFDTFAQFANIHIFRITYAVEFVNKNIGFEATVAASPVAPPTIHSHTAPAFPSMQVYNLDDEEVPLSKIPLLLAEKSINQKVIFVKTTQLIIVKLPLNGISSFPSFEHLQLANLMGRS